jgi:hypothetical protein
MPQRLKWKTDLEKSVVTLNFDRRGWVRQDGDAGRMEASSSAPSLPSQVLNGAGQMSSVLQPVSASMDRMTGGNDWNIYWASVQVNSF